MDIKDLKTFGQRVGFLLDLKDLKNIDLAKAINCAPNTVSNYLNDKRNPDFSTLKLIADFLNVKVDFLLMRTNDYSCYISKTIDGDLIEIELNDETIHITKSEIELVFKKLKDVGFDIKKLL